MKKRIYTNGLNKIEYFVRGNNPEFLMVSGIHGDEHEIIKSVQRAINKYHDNLSDFVYIPTASPTAVKAQARYSACGMDMNRHFIENCKCNEAHAIMRLLGGMKINQCVSFHEDLEHPYFYMYDSGNMEGDECLARLRKDVKDLGVDLLNDIDDINDEHLGFVFVDGYAANIPNTEGKPIGPLETWLIKQGIVTRVFGIEVPGKLDLNIKDKLVEKILYNLAICR